MRVTVVFHRGNPAASVSNDQTRSGLAWMVQPTEHVIRNVLRVFWACGVAVVVIGPSIRIRPGPRKGCGAGSQGTAISKRWPDVASSVGWSVILMIASTAWSVVLPVRGHREHRLLAARP
jgi:hypothetical protein